LLGKKGYVVVVVVESLRACLVTGASIARAITKSTTGLVFQVLLVVPNLKWSQKY